MSVSQDAKKNKNRQANTSINRSVLLKEVYLISWYIRNRLQFRTKTSIILSFCVQNSPFPYDFPAHLVLKRPCLTSGQHILVHDGEGHPMPLLRLQVSRQTVDACIRARLGKHPAIGGRAAAHPVLQRAVHAAGLRKMSVCP